MAGDVSPIGGGEFLLYQTEDGGTRVDVRMENETVWLTQAQMAELFQRERSVITKHIANAFAEHELEPAAVCANFALTAADGKTYDVQHYNLDVIISVGYRVKSLRGTQFRQWATARLRDYIVKGFALDDQRLKQAGGGDYFDELLARIRDIRSSEKLFWRKVLDIYATSIDYDPRAAAHGHTAAEVIATRANASKPNMGLTSWAGAAPKRTDAVIAKNYLDPQEIDMLNRIVTLYLEFAELQAMSRRAMTMADWITKLEQFLTTSDREILTHAGKVSHEVATAKANAEFDRYRALTANAKSAVEAHFEAATKHVKKIEGARKTAKPAAPRKKT